MNAIELRVNSHNGGKDYELQWRLWDGESGVVSSSVEGISCLESDIRNLLSDLADRILVNLPSRLQPKYLMANEGDEGVFTINITKSDCWGVTVTDEISKTQKGFLTPSLEVDPIFSATALVIAQKLDPTLRGRYVFENGIADVNPDHIEPPLTRYFPSK